MSCSIIIRAFNEAQHIARLLEGILRQTYPNPQIILVDSGSTDETTAIAQRYPVQVVTISPGDFTFGRSLNRGLAAATGEFAVIASAHVYPVYPDWLERLLAPLDDPNVGLAYGRQVGTENSHFSERQIFAHWFPEHSDLRQPHPFCNNANAAIRRSLWERFPYDETLTGLEDLAWAKMIQEAGYAVAYVAEAEVIHVHNERPRGVYNRYRREAMAFKRIFPKESFTFLDFLRLAPGNIAGDIVHAARQKELFANLTGILWFRLAQFWGTYQGHRRSGPVTEALRRTFYYPRALHTGSTSPTRNIAPIQYDRPEQQG